MRGSKILAVLVLASLGWFVGFAVGQRTGLGNHRRAIRAVDVAWEVCREVEGRPVYHEHGGRWIRNACRARFRPAIRELGVGGLRRQVRPLAGLRRRRRRRRRRLRGSGSRGVRCRDRRREVMHVVRTSDIQATEPLGAGPAEGLLCAEVVVHCPPMSHRMQHDKGPTWCRDCGRFDYACEGIECTAPGSGAFDNTARRGFQNIEKCIFPPVWMLADEEVSSS